MLLSDIIMEPSAFPTSATTLNSLVAEFVGSLQNYAVTYGRGMHVYIYIYMYIQLYTCILYAYIDTCSR